MAKNSKKIDQPVLFFDKTERFLQQRETLLFWILFGLTAVIALFLYDPRISLAGDDSGYILSADNFLKKHTFPGYQGPLYPIVLSLFVAIFGISLFPLKMVSFISMLAFVYVTYITFRKRISLVLLMPLLLLLSINSFVLYYASQTYSEAFFLFMMSLALYTFFRVTDLDAKASFVRNLKAHFWLALSILGVALTRSVGFAFIIAVVLYFLFYKEWKNLALVLGSFFVIFLAYSFLKGLIWGDHGLQFSGQGSSLMNKNFYHPEQGKEDLSGLLVRFWQNSVQYLSNALFRIIGFDYKLGQNSVLRALGVYGVAIAALLFARKKERPVFFAILLAALYASVTFVVLQVLWNQDRLIIPIYPFILLCILYFFHHLLLSPKLRSFQWIYAVVVAALVFTGMRYTSTAIPQARELSNKYSGLTPDWVHYLKAGEWSERNLKPTDVIACRKPTVSKIYADKIDFYGIFNVPSGNAAAFMSKWAAHPDQFTAIEVSEPNYEKYINGGLCNYYYARTEFDKSAFWIVNNTPEAKESLVKNDLQTIDFDRFEPLVQKMNNKIGVYYADSLLSPFKKNGVTHLLLANLRTNPKEKNGQIIMTVQRYAFYITEKYPNLFEQIYQEGTNDDEPALLYRINWKSVK
jgi:hypothetical protein